MPQMERYETKDFPIIFFRRLDRKHAEEHPDYQYTPRKPSEKKRRGAARPKAKPAKRTRTTTARNTTLGVSSSGLNNNLSATGADADTPNNHIINSNETALAEGTYRFTAAELDSLIAEVESENQRAMIFASANFGMNERLAGEAFELSDFLVDIY
ncbi:uncharacterized protein BP01DRAFT_392291 [Aspergillus saccharolyticus JOP 1030-1]|uniref:HMG box domain-containing protein n=1 Tax=Aspergillus saccharolyticus JOP 1030-1 TaxID=1450539 RepID=A0A318ZBX2_9EURO|nr:hypothetical protein BP01DRAFT_392291 [Aspergillus saccharolyticus JOP 1030-1]PYH44971.1 hypothetical protein BP01DRAFT_392291 [Aspergillus saccharolyticus JOP 1030-1]